ncbi:polyhydroxyalkanoate depolymerase [soil metagenome]
MLYQAYQAHADLMWPLQAYATASLPLLNDSNLGFEKVPMARKIAAAMQVFTLAKMTHKRRPFGIDSVMVQGVPTPVVEEIVNVTPFATLLRFKKTLPKSAAPHPKVLIVAPMSGHFATLLRDTVKTTLADHDVYITDWHNGRDMPLSAGPFGLDEYTDHLIAFLGIMGPGSHMMAICQPCVAALAATAIMSEDANPATPLSLTLMAGPIDCRISPTAVNKLATEKPMSWFEEKLIGVVPMRYPGAMRKVYPGFIQLSAFMAMNKQRHMDSFKELYRNLVSGELEKAQITKTFYEEYFAVADLPAEFYLETVRLVFQEYALPKGELMYRGRLVKPSLIRRTALLTVEGERDDICATGQTLAAQDLCTGLREYMRTHYVQAGVGHYGVFSGKRWQNSIYPIVRDTIHVSQ